MADKSIGELIAAQSVTPTDLFVLEQNGTAKRLTGQILENWLVSFADGHGGIQSIEKISTSGLADTYRITLADTTTFDFVLTNGRGVSSLEKTGTSGLVDTYTFTYNDGTTDTFTVTNGEKGDKGDNTYIWIKYASQEPTETSHSFGDIPDDWIGIYFGVLNEAPTDWQQYAWFKIKGEKGETGEPAMLVSSEVRYQVGESGTIIPSGTWLESVPVVAQGKYLWTKMVQQFNTGAPITYYSVARMGIDGLGSVVSVAGVSPEVNGNVPLTAENVNALSITGGTMEGNINMNGQKLSGLNMPVEDDEAATKGYALAKDRVVNSFSVTEAGYAADARALKTLKELIDAGMSADLLWENASPDSDFAAQNVAVDLSEHSCVMIEFVSAVPSTIVRKGKTVYAYHLNVTSTSSNATVLELGRRALSADNSKINFTDANRTMYTTSSGRFNDTAVTNSIIKPNKIYGLKGVE